MPEQLHRFDYCQYLRSTDDFERYTNVRELVMRELRDCVRSIGRADVFFKEVKNVDQFIETIFADFLSMKDAFCCTLLKDLRFKSEFLESNLFVYDCMCMKRTKLCIRVFGFKYIFFVLLTFIFAAIQRRSRNVHNCDADRAVATTQSV